MVATCDSCFSTRKSYWSHKVVGYKLSKEIFLVRSRGSLRQSLARLWSRLVDGTTLRSSWKVIGHLYQKAVLFGWIQPNFSTLKSYWSLVLCWSSQGSSGSVSVPEKVIGHLYVFFDLNGVFAKFQYPKKLLVTYIMKTYGELLTALFQYRKKLLVTCNPFPEIRLALWGFQYPKKLLVTFTVLRRLLRSRNNVSVPEKVIGHIHE